VDCDARAEPLVLPRRSKDRTDEADLEEADRLRVSTLPGEVASDGEDFDVGQEQRPLRETAMRLAVPRRVSLPQGGGPYGQEVRSRSVSRLVAPGQGHRSRPSVAPPVVPMPRYVLSKGALAVERDEPKISALDADGDLLQERRHAIARLPRSAPLLDFYLVP
jgi:hypothetical protein